MANIKITDLSAIADPISTDVLPIVDVSADTTNKVSIETLLKNAAAGTAALPAFAFDADPNTGMYRSGADALAFSTGGTGRLFIDASGNVGVGTASPGKELEISSSSLGSAARIRDSAGYADFLVYNNNISFGLNGSEKARIDSSGRLLLGASSTSTNTQMVVQGSSSASSGPGILYLARGNNSPLNGYGIGELYFTDSGHATSTRSAASIACARDGGTWTSGTSMPGRLVFSTTADNASSPTERLKLDSAGSLINFTDNNSLIRSARTASTDSVFTIQTGSTNIGNGTTRFRVMGDGDAENTNNSYTGISDIKLKENIVDANSQWSDIRALQVRYYNFKEETNYGTHTQIGLVAQEVETVSPGLVKERNDVDENGNDLGTVTKSVNYSVLYMKAVKALQEAMERIEQLEQRLTDAGL